ncbi:MAG: sulfate adenylyltransferase [Dehalococcoidia bacterium]
MVDNALSPHGGTIVERLEEPAKAKERIKGLPRIEIRSQIAREVMSIAYGYFSPLEGFMTQADVDSVVNKLTLASGYVWSIPIVFDIGERELQELGAKQGDTVLLTYQGNPLATLDIEEVFSYDLDVMAEKVYGTKEDKHPGVRRTKAYAGRFLGGKVTIVNPPKINPPFDEFFYPPRRLREEFSRRGWKRVVAHQTRNVPHTGHEWLMKGAWFEANADAVLANPVIGEKRAGDYIDEAIIVTHDALRKAGYFAENIHMTSFLFWDMRYAGPREAVFHAIVRKNLGCTHHMFGRDHAGVGTYYDPYAAHEIFEELPDLGIYPVKALEWFYCPECAGIAYEEQCGHKDAAQRFSGSLIRSIIQDGVQPPRLLFRPEIFELVMECAEKYGGGSPFVTENYLKRGDPVMTVPAL